MKCETGRGAGAQTKQRDPSEPQFQMTALKITYKDGLKMHRGLQGYIQTKSICAPKNIFSFIFNQGYKNKKKQRAIAT